MPVQCVKDQCFTGKDTLIVAYLPTQYQLHGLFNIGWIFMVGVAGKEGRESCYVFDVGRSVHHHTIQIN